MLSSGRCLNPYGCAGLRHFKAIISAPRWLRWIQRAALGGPSLIWEAHPHHRPGAGGERGRQNLDRNLNKQEINSHRFYKLQHDGTVECIDYTGAGGKKIKGGGGSTVFTKFNSKKVEGKKKQDFFSFFFF